MLILGDGPLRDNLDQLANDLGVRSHVIFQPGSSDVEEWLRATDIFVLPSHSESFSNALLEAMACGCCVIGSRVGGTPELIHEGETGFLFEAGDADDLAAKLRLALDDAALRTRLSAAAASYTHNTLSLQRFVQRLENLYTDRIGAARSRRAA